MECCQVRSLGLGSSASRLRREPKPRPATGSARQTSQRPRSLSRIPVLRCSPAAGRPIRSLPVRRDLQRAGALANSATLRRLAPQAPHDPPPAHALLVPMSAFPAASIRHTGPEIGEGDIRCRLGAGGVDGRSSGLRVLAKSQTERRWAGRSGRATTGGVPLAAISPERQLELLYRLNTRAVARPGLHAGPTRDSASRSVLGGNSGRAFQGASMPQKHILLRGNYTCRSRIKGDMHTFLHWARRTRTDAPLAGGVVRQRVHPVSRRRRRSPVPCAGFPRRCRSLCCRT